MLNRDDLTATRVALLVRIARIRESIADGTLTDSKELQDKIDQLKRIYNVMGTWRDDAVRYPQNRSFLPPKE